MGDYEEPSCVSELGSGMPRDVLQEDNSDNSLAWPEDPGDAVGGNPTREAEVLGRGGVLGKTHWAAIMQCMLAQEVSAAPLSLSFSFVQMYVPMPGWNVSLPV